jgi:hypothetical protein
MGGVVGRNRWSATDVLVGLVELTLRPCGAGMPGPYVGPM